jgi:hypothetical protein
MLSILVRNNIKESFLFMQGLYFTEGKLVCGFTFLDLNALFESVSRCFLPRLGQEIQGGRVYLETFSEWGRSISEDVAQVCLTV